LNLYKGWVINHDKRAIYHETYYPGSVNQEGVRLATETLRRGLIEEVFDGEPSPVAYQSRTLGPTFVAVISTIRNQIFEKIAAHGRPIALVATLDQTIEQLNTLIVFALRSHLTH
jgi:hypothetical protein